MNRIPISRFLFLALMLGVAVGCGSTTVSAPRDAASAQSGGAGGGPSGAGGGSGTGGSAGTGGMSGSVQSGGSGGSAATGGMAATGGRAGSGGGIVFGGVTMTGGTVATGGVATTGGVRATGGSTGSGGALGTGGATGAGGSTIVVTPGNRIRTILPLDTGWLFNKGDASGADQTAFADTTWRQVNVPHDWSIEGPFDENAATTGRGGYLPSGIAWYRKHFTLPSSVTSSQQVTIEFDGVMANSTVYLNGTALGTHPYGYASFRYDMTRAIKFGAENVVSVKTDTTSQPASRFYAGAGIYRHVRLLATDPVHVGQWATYVTTPAPTATLATVHVTTSVVNAGTASQSVSVQGIVSDPSGTALAPVTAPAQDIAAGASGDFTFDIPVANPKLWDLTTPNLYRLTTDVLVGGKTIDDDVTPFGIREIKFDAGMTLNGKSVKFQGVCLHQDYHGLGLAAPQRAMQRRLAQLKTYGVNAIRTAHEPPSPDFLELTDRMGLLVLDEFTDVWTGHKYTDVGDYATYFNKTATAPTGMPAVPTVTGVSNTGATWWQVDFTGWIMRDRNHPSVALYSMGNEIRDSLATRTPILTKMVDMSHALDPSRGVTQALFQPDTNGDIGAATNALLDVWGDNYHVDSVLTAMVDAPTKSGLITEMGTATSTWATVKANAALTGLFMWTGVDYLGESDGGWPTVGSSAGILDEMGTPKSLAFSWQTTWGLTKTTFTTGAAAGKVVLTPDHAAITADVNDVSFVRAAVSTDTAVTFSITGPGTIVAVDSASMTQETFRGNTRNTSGGLAFAIVQATGTGAITVTAKASGLTDGTATITASEGAFVPCSGTCD